MNNQRLLIKTSPQNAVHLNCQIFNFTFQVEKQCLPNLLTKKYFFFRLTVSLPWSSSRTAKRFPNITARGTWKISRASWASIWRRKKRNRRKTSYKSWLDNFFVYTKSIYFCKLLEKKLNNACFHFRTV